MHTLGGGVALILSFPVEIFEMRWTIQAVPCSPVQEAKPHALYACILVLLLLSLNLEPQITLHSLNFCPFSHKTLIWKISPVNLNISSCLN